MSNPTRKLSSIEQRLAWGKQRLAWDREALGLKTLPKDLHPHVRKRELLRRAVEAS